LDIPERHVLRIPILGRFLARRMARLKREVCLGLNGLGLLKPITFVQWLVTNACNFRCSFCEASAGHASEDELTTDEARIFIDDLAGMGVRCLVLSGGEPLVRPDIIELMRYARARGLEVGLVSNGYRVPELWPELRGIGLDFFFTSLDGPREMHDAIRGTGAYDRTIEALHLFSEDGVPTRIANTVVRSENLDLLPELRDLVAATAANRWHLTPMARVGRATDDSETSLDGAGIRRVIDLVREGHPDLTVAFGESCAYLGFLDGGSVGKPFFCGAGLTRCAVMPDGTVLGCHQIYDRSFAEGNVRERPFSRIWREEFRRFRTHALPGFCRGCDHIDACQGGCWAESALHGTCAKALLDDGPSGRAGEPA
jgi:radical SAM protein with 4Fe4S-binding SPASM domain